MPANASLTHRRRTSLVLRCAGLLVWAVVAFGGSWFARDLQVVVAGWPLNFWIAAQGALLVFIAIVAGWAWWRNRHGDPSGDDDAF